ncbi:hypothetical protein CBM2606_A90250 [Cupriavidus taiwanensis]|nr:hypothetical protein CBM2606_A90250 [Cupriavidus taiwanensis]
MEFAIIETGLTTIDGTRNHPNILSSRAARIYHPIN